MSNRLKCVVMAIAGVAFGAGAASANTCIGNCGTGSPNGVVTAPPSYGPDYSYVSSYNGLVGAGQIASVGGGDPSATGSEYLTSPFSAKAGDALNFDFNYVTADGSGSYTDYAFAELLSGTNHVAYLFTARTTPSGNTSPGFDLPANDSVLTPSSTPIIGGAPVWDELGDSSGTCFDDGCGYTGWINSAYTLSKAGDYRLRFGVTNYGDDAVQSGLAFAGVTVAGNPITAPVPEPATWASMFVGLAGAGGWARRRRKLGSLKTA